MQGISVQNTHADLVQIKERAAGRLAVDVGAVGWVEIREFCNALAAVGLGMSSRVVEQLSAAHCASHVSGRGGRINWKSFLVLDQMYSITIQTQYIYCTFGLCPRSVHPGKIRR